MTTSGKKLVESHSMREIASKSFQVFPRLLFLVVVGFNAILASMQIRPVQSL
jgi:hypothetical protein